MKPHYYILDGHTPVPITDLFAWGRWRETGDRTVARTQIDGPVEVSTVFLGIDHQWGNGPPLLFETMIFCGDAAEDYQERYSTWAEAEAGHQRAVAWARQRTSCHVGFVCETCFDAPACTFVPAPWGGEMGICAACQQTGTSTEVAS